MTAFDWFALGAIVFLALVLAPVMVAGHESDEERKRE